MLEFIFAMELGLVKSKRGNNLIRVINNGGLRVKVIVLI